MGKYQEKEHWSDYKKNRERVCEVMEETYLQLYGEVRDYSNASCHHIEPRSDHLKEERLKDADLNRKANLYPFLMVGGEEDHTNVEYHNGKNGLHNKIGRMEFERKRDSGELGWQTGDWEVTEKKKRKKKKRKRKGKRRRRW